jgi:HK97 family phage portal protein
MGLLFGSRAPQERALTLTDMGVPERTVAGTTGQPATPDRAMRFSAVWAALRLRSDLISTLPVDVFRRTSDGAQVPAPGSALFTQPASGMRLDEWLYATQMDLDRYGNCFGHIVARDAAGYPLQVEPWPASEVRVRMDGYRIRSYVYQREEFTPLDVWHERQYAVAGLKVGLSPLQYAAWVIGAGLSAQEFGLDFYANGAHPTGTLRHTEAANLDPEALTVAKQRFKAATANRDIFATGKEWEFTPTMVDANTSKFLDAQSATAVDVCRYIGVPANSIDAVVSGQSVTYSNLSQRQLDLLVNFLGPAIIRREKALTAALPAPRFVKFNSDAMLRLDTTQRTDLVAKQIDSWVMTPDEARALENRPPLTEADIALLQSRRTTKTPDEGTTP